MSKPNRWVRSLVPYSDTMIAVAVVTVVLVLLLLVSAISRFFPDAVAQQSTRPNIVVIMTDDQTLRDMEVMTNVNSLLVNTGTTFSNHFVNYSWCCPSRATFLTGQVAHNHGVMSNAAPDGGYSKLDHSNTLAVWLQQAGYHTVAIGKYLNQYGLLEPRTTIPSGWTEWYVAPDPDVYMYYNYSINENGTLVFYGEGEENYQTDVFSRKATDFIVRMASSSTPFFLYVAVLAPHDDLNSLTRGPEPALRHKGAFADRLLPVKASINELDVSDKPVVIQQFPIVDLSTIDRWTLNYQGRLESLLAVDEAVASIINALKSVNKLKDTVVIFTSDNGFLIGEHRLWGHKIFPYEESIRVPLVIRYPGYPRQARKEMVSNIDLAPTIVELAGASAGRVMDGRSLVPLLQGSTVPWRKSLLIEAVTGDLGLGVSSLNIHFSALRTSGYLYVEHDTGEKELYNFVNDVCNVADPLQLTSQHANPCYADLISRLSGQLNTLKTCAGDTC